MKLSELIKSGSALAALGMCLGFFSATTEASAVEKTKARAEKPNSLSLGTLDASDPEAAKLRSVARADAPAPVANQKEAKLESYYTCGDREFAQNDASVHRCWNEVDPQSPTLQTKSRGVGVRIK